VFARGQDGEHRGLTPGFLEGPRHQRLVRGRAPRHRGVYAGRVTRAAGRRVWVALEVRRRVRLIARASADRRAPGHEERQWMLCLPRVLHVASGLDKRRILAGSGRG